LRTNAGCVLDHKRAEHVTWPAGIAPHGTYEVIVDSYELCAFSSINYVVTVNVTGKAPQLFYGNFTMADQGSACWVATGTPLSCGRLITTFTYPCPRPPGLGTTPWAVSKTASERLLGSQVDAACWPR